MAQEHFPSFVEGVFSDSDSQTLASTSSPVKPPTIPRRPKRSPLMEGPRITEVRPPRRYPIFTANTKAENIVRGGFGPLEKPARKPFRCYPPPANNAYVVDSELRARQLHDARFEREVGDVEGLGIGGLPPDVKSTVEPITPATSPEEDDAIHDIFCGTTVKTVKTKGQILADQVDFNLPRPKWVTRAPGFSSRPTLSPEEQKEQLIKEVDHLDTQLNGKLVVQIECFDRKDKDQMLVEICIGCGIRHILPGNRLTLAARDRCFAHLPEWFPRNEKVNPWPDFNKLTNELQALHETVLGGCPNRKDPGQPQWNLHFHERHEEQANVRWTTNWARSYGGWWKCRSDANAPEIERQCHHCHKPITEADFLAAQNAVPHATRLRELEEWIAWRIKEQGQKDKEAALEILESQGIPQHFGAPLNEAGRIQLMDSRPGGRQPLAYIKATVETSPLQPKRFPSPNFYKPTR